MSWDTRILDLPQSESLIRRVDVLFQQQIEHWSELKEGVQGLNRARSRRFQVCGFPVTATHIPHRIGSTMAAVDSESIRRRACFLCSKNLPEAERAVAFGSDYAVAYNPYPILKRHMTIVLRQHLPQSIEGRFTKMLALSAELPGYAVLYNGPQCGASAPDHMHFQACHYDAMPLIDDGRRASNGVIEGYPRAVVVLRDSESARLGSRFSELLDALREHNRERPEPLLNVVAVSEHDMWTVFVFPRSKHRPRVFHTGELTWSPGAIDLCGVVVLPLASDLDRITSSDIADVFKEVSLDPESVATIARRLRLT